MNVLIVDPSLVPDSAKQQGLAQHFANAGDISVRFATGILQATWQTRAIHPDVIVIEWIDDCEQLRKLIALLRRISPAVAMFHLEGGSLVAAENPCEDSAGPVVPHWLRYLAGHWLQPWPAPLPAMSPVHTA